MWKVKFICSKVLWIFLKTLFGVLGEESTRFKSPGGSKSEEGPTKLTRSSSKQLQGL